MMPPTLAGECCVAYKSDLLAANNTRFPCDPLSGSKSVGTVLTSFWFDMMMQSDFAHLRLHYANSEVIIPFGPYSSKMVNGKQWRQ